RLTQDDRIPNPRAAEQAIVLPSADGCSLRRAKGEQTHLGRAIESSGGSRRPNSACHVQRRRSIRIPAQRILLPQLRVERGISPGESPLAAMAVPAYLQEAPFGELVNRVPFVPQRDGGRIRRLQLQLGRPRFALNLGIDTDPGDALDAHLLV